MEAPSAASRLVWPPRRLIDTSTGVSQQVLRAKQLRGDAGPDAEKVRAGLIHVERHEFGWTRERALRQPPVAVTD